jgi:N-acetylglucosamine-6-phosphate deacetylase
MTSVRVGRGRLLLGNSLEVRTLVLDGGRIVSADESSDAPDIDAAGLIVSPGFVDVQINGGFGIDLLSDPGAMWQLGRHLPSTGVTAFLPTIITSPTTSTTAALDALHARPDGYFAAEPLGLHFEGPMLNPDRRGAHQVQHMVEPSIEVIDGWSRRDGVTIVTLAPELPGALQVITELVSRGVVVSAGHTNADSSETLAALEAGLSGVTHLFNAMAPVGHRQPNLAGVALAERDLIAGLIADGIHVDPIVVAAAWNAKGHHGIGLVTDAVAAMGQPPGAHEFAGRTTSADESGVRNSDGTLAGSALTMDQAVRNLVEFTGCQVHEALLAATATPARLIGDTSRGRIRPGAHADLVLLDADLRVQITICAGRVVYVADGARDRLAPHLRAMG